LARITTFAAGATAGAVFADAVCSALGDPAVADSAGGVVVAGAAGAGLVAAWFVLEAGGVGAAGAGAVAWLLLPCPRTMAGAVALGAGVAITAGG
jgi:hypothetical protein